MMGVALAVLSGLCNGLFTTPMKLESRWKWENIWFTFILVACLLMPAALVFSSAGWSTALMRESLEWGSSEGLGPDIVEGIRRIKSQDGSDLILG